MQLRSQWVFKEQLNHCRSTFLTAGVAWSFITLGVRQQEWEQQRRAKGIVAPAACTVWFQCRMLGAVLATQDLHCRTRKNKNANTYTMLKLKTDSQRWDLHVLRWCRYRDAGGWRPRAALCSPHLDKTCGTPTTSNKDAKTGTRVKGSSGRPTGNWILFYPAVG